MRIPHHYVQGPQLTRFMLLHTEILVALFSTSWSFCLLLRILSERLLKSILPSKRIPDCVSAASIYFPYLPCLCESIRHIFCILSYILCLRFGPTKLSKRIPTVGYTSDTIETNEYITNESTAATFRRISHKCGPYDYGRNENSQFINELQHIKFRCTDYQKRFVSDCGRTFKVQMMIQVNPFLRLYSRLRSNGNR